MEKNCRYFSKNCKKILKYLQFCKSLKWSSDDFGKLLEGRKHLLVYNFENLYSILFILSNLCDGKKIVGILVKTAKNTKIPTIL